MGQSDKRQEDFWFTLLRREEERALWHPELELIFVLKGTGRVCLMQNGPVYRINEGDIFAVNSFQILELELDGDAYALSLSISLHYLTSISPELLSHKVNCRSFLYPKDRQGLYDVLRRNLARAFQAQYKYEMRQSLSLKNRIAALLENLVQYFREEEEPQPEGGSWERLKPAIDYIQNNYRDPITLEDLSEHTFLSRTYISHSFRRYLGVSFMEYLARVRICHAVRMMYGRETLTEIAYNSGFPNVNAMIKAFKQYRGMTPGEYRKQAAQPQTALQPAAEEPDEMNHVFSSLMNYALEDPEVKQPKETVRELMIDLEGRKPRITQHWKRIMNAGYARELLDGARQQEIILLQKQIGFEYIRVKGILDDDMCLLRTDMNGNRVKNFTYVDEAIDFIVSAGAKPMVELSSMPRLLARSVSISSMRAGVFSYPESLEAWRDLIQSLLEHLAERHGRERVRQWLFAPWLIPDYVDFGVCTAGEYEEIYAVTYETIKSVCGNFLVCGPGTTDCRKYLPQFLAMCRRRDCMPDIITFRSFAAVNPEEEEDGLNLIAGNESFPMAVSRDEDILFHLSREVHRILDQAGAGELPLVLEEWSSTIWQRDLCNDTCYKSAYLFKNVLENNDQFSGMGYFSLNDRLDEIPPVPQMFCGGFGLFTKNSVKKSAYRAMELLAQMGDRLLEKGSGYFISQRNEEIQIFLYNYCHYDLLYRYRHTVNMTQTNRYHVFQPKEAEAFFIQLSHPVPGKYRIKRYAITRQGGSSYDAWLRMGAPETLTREETAFLEAGSYPEYRTDCVEVQGEEPVLNIRASVKPLEVMLIKIQRE